MKVACIQLAAGDDKQKNIAKAVLLVKKAIAQKAEFILLPEVFVFRGKLDGIYRREIPEKVPGESLKSLAALAKRCRVHILAGSIFEKDARVKKVFNTSCLIGPDGKIKAVYRKKNLFKASLGSKKFDESKNFASGKKEVAAYVGLFKVGLSVCYDLRFPEMFRRYAQSGATVLCVPSAFTYKTGSAHWEILLRARAIENLAYVLAPNQVGTDSRGVRHYGNSMIVDPWGNVLKRASAAKEEIIYADLDLKKVKAVRSALPNILRKK